MPALEKPQIHRKILDALDDRVERHGDVDDVPFLLKPTGLLPLAVFAFTVTDPPGGREATELKIQFIAPGQGRHERGRLDPPDDETFLILLGYSEHYDVFVLWDAYKHRDFAFSKNCQIRLYAITDARLTGIGEHKRQVQAGPETIVTARPDHLHDALTRRIHLA